MHLSQKSVDRMVLSTAILWITILVMALCGMGYAAIFPVIAITAIHFIIGLADSGVISKILFYRTFVPWIVLFTIGIFFMVYFEIKFDGTAPSFYLLGMHPAMFFELFFYWIFPFILVSGSLYIYRKTWLSDERWNQFMKEIGKEQLK